MDLVELRDSLAANNVKFQTRHAAVGDAPAAAEQSRLVNEILARHGRSQQPESQQLCAILAALVDVIKSQQSEPTPAALFAAIMTSLGKPETLANLEVVAAMCNLLDMVFARLSDAIIRNRYLDVLNILLKAVEASASSPAAQKASGSCLCHAVCAMDPADWLASVPSFQMLISMSLDQRPKVRKRVQGGLEKAVASLQRNPSALAGASDLFVKMAHSVLPAPEAAARAAAAAPGKKRQQAEEAITAAVSNALHFLGLLKRVLPYLSGNAITEMCDLIVRLYPLRQPLLTLHATETVSTLFASPVSHLNHTALSGLLEIILGDSAAGAALDGKESNAAISYIKCIEEGCLKLYELDPSLGFASLPRAFQILIPQLASSHTTVRFATAQCLKNLVNSCCGDIQAIDAAVSRSSSARGSVPALLKIISCIENSLGARYQDSWIDTLSISAELFRALANSSKASQVLTGIFEKIGEMCAGADDAAGDALMAGCDENEEDQAIMRNKIVLAAQDALGVGIQCLGPEVVLAVLPVNLVEGLEGSEEPRTWMLPLLKLHVQGARLSYWGHTLLPLARSLGSRASKAGRDAQVCTALEAQIWETLPSFCRWAEDAGNAFRKYSKDIAAAFENRTDLRPSICSALLRLCLQTKYALQHHHQPAGHADPCAGKGAEDDESHRHHSHREDDDEQLEEMPHEETFLSEIPETYTAAVAQEHVAAIRTASKVWLPLLLNAFISTPSASRRHLAAAISAYACISEPALVAQAFKVALAKYLKVTEQAKTGELGPDAILEGGETDGQRRCTYLEAALVLSGGVDAQGIHTLYNVARSMAEEREPSLQKKGYKVLAYVLESRPDYTEVHFEAMVNWLVQGVTTSVSAAKRFRLRCLRSALLTLVHTASEDKQKTRDVIAGIVAELILSLKEANQKTRAAAYDLLVEVAAAMHEEDPSAAAAGESMVDSGCPPPDNGGLHALFSMVLGGLVGATPHMISASVMALARLLYEFAPVLMGVVPDLLPAVLMLLRSKAREVIKSVLGFVKVVAVRLPTPELEASLPAVLEGILLWAEDSKNKFRLKVRVILERLARRCGFEALERNMPEAHKRLLVHIRKASNRKDRRRAVAAEKGAEEDEDMDMEGDFEVARSRRAGRAPTHKASSQQWNDDVFNSDEDNDERHTKHSMGGGSDRRGGMRSRGRVAAHEEPVDLLDPGTSRQLVRTAAGAAGGQRNGNFRGVDDFEHDTRGKMIIREEQDVFAATKRPKRKRGGFDSDDSDLEDLKEFTGVDLALKGSKSVALAPTIAKSLAGRSLGARSRGGRSVQSAPSDSAQTRRGAQHTGDRFKARRKGTAGDVKGNSKVEPYAYWPLDKNMLNRRAQKTRSAKKGLDTIVNAARQGASKGRKFKRSRM